MAYDLEKYRDKREKVLGVKKRGISFGTLAMIVSMTIVVGLGFVVIPKSIAYFHTRHLDDAIYKLQSGAAWSRDSISKTRSLAGVQNVEADGNGSRIVVTYNRELTDTAKISSFYKHTHHPRAGQICPLDLTISHTPAVAIALLSLYL